MKDDERLIGDAPQRKQFAARGFIAHAALHKTNIYVGGGVLEAFQIFQGPS